jgi:hypothetical protein
MTAARSERDAIKGPAAAGPFSTGWHRDPELQTLDQTLSATGYVPAPGFEFCRASHRLPSLSVTMAVNRTLEVSVAW